jgi:hypothetical protein
VITLGVCIYLQRAIRGSEPYVAFRRIVVTFSYYATADHSSHGPTLSGTMYEVTSQVCVRCRLGNVWYFVDGGTAFANIDTSIDTRFPALPAGLESGFAALTLTRRRYFHSTSVLDEVRENWRKPT